MQFRSGTITFRPALLAGVAALVLAQISWGQSGADTTGGSGSGNSGANSGSGTSGGATSTTSGGTTGGTTGNSPGAASSFPSGIAPASPNAPATGTSATLPNGATNPSNAASMLLDSPFTGAPSATTPGTPGAPSFRTGAGAASNLPEAFPSTIPGLSTSPTKPAGAASAFGGPQTDEATSSRLQPAPTTFSVPGLYGQGTQVFTAGSGRLARPSFRFGGNVSMGYDDNIFQTPTRGASTRDQKVQVLVDPGTPATTKEVVVPSGDPLVPNTISTVVVPGTDPKFRTQKIPGIRAPEREGSFITRASGSFDMQLATRQTLFTFDFSGGVDYYWNRPNDPEDYNGSLALIYLRKLNGRTQFTMEAHASYQSQPDFSQVNSPTSNQVGSYITANLKADLSYRLTPRFSTVISVTYDTIYYVEKAMEQDTFDTTGAGVQLRYLVSPRWTLLGELRYSTTTHSAADALNTSSVTAIVGGELSLSRRMAATLRIGAATQTFEDSGESKTTPYGEGTLNYRLGAATSVSWNGRYGYEVASTPDTQQVVLRTGLSLNQTFSPRLQGSLGVNYVHTTTETSLVDIAQDTIDSNLSLSYALTRRWSLSLNYTYTTLLMDDELQNYYRQRVFLGASFGF